MIDRNKRHPEKVNKPVNPIKKKPYWIRSKILNSKVFFETKKIVNQSNLVTVCQEANCPNITECWSKKHATFMIMGDTCTRACAFCDVKTGKPGVLDEFEPIKISNADGLPVLTSQNAQALVQVSPIIMKVACFLLQHSLKFGHRASSHTVTKFWSFIIFLVSSVLSDGNLIFSHLGLLGLGIDEKFFLNRDFEINRVSCTI